MNQKLSFWEKAGYGFGGMAVIIPMQLIGLYQYQYYNSVFTGTMVTIISLFTISTIITVPFNIGIGLIADRTNTRWGKFKPYLLFTALPLAIFSVLYFMIPDLNATLKLMYACATIFIITFLNSAVTIPYSSLLGVISSDPAERMAASSARLIGINIALFIIPIINIPLANSLGQENMVFGLRCVVAVFSVVTIGFLIITFFSTRERTITVKERAPIDQDLGRLVNNGPWIILIFVTLLLTLIIGIRSSMAHYYFKYYIGTQEIPWLTGAINFILNIKNNLFNKVTPLLSETHLYSEESLISIFNTIAFCFNLIGLIIMFFLVKFIRKKTVFFVLIIITMVGIGCNFFLSPNNLAAVFGIQALASLAWGPLLTILWAMYADTADYSEWKTGHRITGLMFASFLISYQIGYFITSLLTGLLLALTDFTSGIEQTYTVLYLLKSMMSIIPILFGVPVLIIFIFYKLNDTFMKQINETLAFQRSQPAALSPRKYGMFSFKGRITRSIFWGVTLFIHLVFAAFGLILFISVANFFKPYNVNLSLYFIIAILFSPLVILLFWIRIGTHVKRWHDLGYSGLMEFIVLVPVIGLLAVDIWLGFVKGNTGANQYGPDLLEFQNLNRRK